LSRFFTPPEPSGRSPGHHLSAASKEFVIVTKRKGLAAAGVVALIAAGSAACGTAHATPQTKVENAFTKLSNQKSLTMGLSFDATSDQIYAALKDEDDFTASDAKMLASLHMKLAVASGKKFSLLDSASKAVNDDSSAVDFQLSNDPEGKKSLIEVVSVDKKLYLRADIKGLHKLDASGDSSDDAEFNEFLANAEKLPSSLASVKAAVKGEWIMIDPKAYVEYLKSMADKYGGGSDDGSDSSGDSLNGLIPGMPSTPKIDAKTQKQLVEALRTALSHNATYKDLGKNHVQVSVPAKQFAQELKTSLRPIVDQIPDFDANDLNGLDDVPNRTVTVDVGVKGGSVSSVTFDLAQLDTTITGGKLPLKLTLDRDVDGISAPKGALQLNPQDLMGLVMTDPSMSDDAYSDDEYSDDGSSEDDSSYFDDEPLDTGTF
jgi:hypothetical protein